MGIDELNGKKCSCFAKFLYSLFSLRVYKHAFTRADCRTDDKKASVCRPVMAANPHYTRKAADSMACVKFAPKHAKLKESVFYPRTPTSLILLPLLNQSSTVCFTPLRRIFKSYRISNI